MKPILITTLAGALCCVLGSTGFAGDPHSGGTKGQPNQSCEVTMVTPGKAATVRGSAFNPNGVAGAVYANPTSRGGISSGNTPRRGPIRRCVLSTNRQSRSRTRQRRGRTWAPLGYNLIP